MSGGSSADQTQNTETSDNRIVAAQDSTNLNNSHGQIGGNVTITSTDHGAVHDSLQLTSGVVSQAFEFGTKVQAGAAKENVAALQGIQNTTSTAINAVQSAYQQESKTLADAYVTSKAGEQKILVGVALAIVGIVAALALKKGG
jgi:hypothetical protein